MVRGECVWCEEGGGGEDKMVCESWMGGEMEEFTYTHPH